MALAVALGALVVATVPASRQRAAASGDAAPHATPRADAATPMRGGTAAAFRSATACKPCHPEIYDEWRQSAMARSVVLAGPLLRQSLAFLRATGEGERIRELCYACHAPLARRDGSLDLDAAPLDEGVTCDYCHSVRTVEASPAINAATVVPDGVKSGPHADARSPGHGTLALPLLGRSEFCAGCHYFAWPTTGMPVDWTYAQWAASPYRAEGVECQSCHMPPRPGRASALASAPDRGSVASHRFAGARDVATLRGALALRAHREGATAMIEIENVGAGHSIPGGGGDLRQLELRVVSTGAGRRVEARRYELRYLDEDGERVSSSDDEAVRFEDTTIKARETRVERIALAPEVAARVELWFWYVSEAAAAREGVEPEGVLVTSATLAPVGHASSRRDRGRDRVGRLAPPGRPSATHGAAAPRAAPRALRLTGDGARAYKGRP
jgi:hypothetical protein